MRCRILCVERVWLGLVAPEFHFLNLLHRYRRELHVFGHVGIGSHLLLLFCRLVLGVEPAICKRCGHPQVRTDACRRCLVLLLSPCSVASRRRISRVRTWRVYKHLCQRVGGCFSWGLAGILCCSLAASFLVLSRHWSVIALITHADAFRVSARDGFASTAAGVVRTGVVTTLCLALLSASSSSSMST